MLLQIKKVTQFHKMKNWQLSQENNKLPTKIWKKNFNL